MGAPALKVQIQGQTTASADNLNTYEQTCDDFVQLRGLIGITGMQVFVRGQTAPNDGAAGDFYWSSNATGPDDNMNVIVPTGAATGAWIRLTINASGATNFYTFPTTAALLAAFGSSVSLPNSTTAQTNGRTIEGDGGGGVFWYDKADTTTPDNGGTIRIDAHGRRWYLDYSGAVNVLWFGADATGVNDSAPAFRAAILAAGDEGSVKVPSAITLNGYRLNSGIQFGGTPPYADLASHLIGEGNAFLNFYMPPQDQWVGDGSTKTFTLGSPIGTDVASVYLNGSWQNSGYTISGSTLTFASAPTNGYAIQLARDCITISSYNSTMKNFFVFGNFSGGDIINVRNGVFLLLENVLVYNAGGSCIALMPSIGSNFTEDITLINVTAGACREACYKIYGTPNSFNNILNGINASARSGSSVPDTCTASVSSSSSSVILAGYTFHASDENRQIYIAGAGAAGAALVTYITGGTYGTGNITINTAASTTVAGALCQIGCIACHYYVSDAHSTTSQNSNFSWYNGEIDAALASDAVRSTNITNGGYLQNFSYDMSSIEATGYGCPGYGFNFSSLTLGGLYAGFGQQGNFTGIALGVTGATSLIRWAPNGPLAIVTDRNGSNDDPRLFVEGGKVYVQGDATNTYVYEGTDNAGTVNFTVALNGNVENTNNSYGAISDAKLKQDVVPATSQWNDVKALAIVAKKFRHKTKPDEPLQLGFVAQDIEAISPGLVVETPDHDKDGKIIEGVTTKSVKYSVAFMKMFVAFGEAIGRIEALEAEVAALKPETPPSVH